MKVLVVPTIREESIGPFLKKWIEVEYWDSIIVVEDHAEKKIDLSEFPAEIEHFCWEDIEKDLGEYHWIISRQDSAIRSYGFLKAYQKGAKYIFTLDDDCLPMLEKNAFTNEHINNLERTPKWCESVLGFRTRGLPYKNLGYLNNVVFSMGLWHGVPDFDSIQSISNPDSQIKLPETRVIPRGQYFPFCGMNFAFKREVAVLTYFPLMGKDSPFSRFDDIWFGLIAKKICDHLDLVITCGKPYIYHSRASDSFVNLIKEAPGIKCNENFWEIIDSVPLTKATPASCVNEMGRYLVKSNDRYIAKLGFALEVWSDLFPD